MDKNLIHSTHCQQIDILFVDSKEMSLEGPLTPVDEYSTSFITIPDNVTVEQIEETVADVHGRVNIMNKIMSRDMPECASKAGISIRWGQIYGDYMECFRLYCIGGTGGMVYADNSLLSPDLSLWDFKDPHRLFDTEGGVHEHLMRQGPAPNWILEYEWHSELLKEGKGVDKVENGFFNKLGTNDTRVDEAWILVKHQDVPVVQEPPPIGRVLRVLRRLADATIIGWLVFWPLLWFLDTISGTNRYTGKAIRRDGPPPDPSTPYLIVYFRNNQHVPFGYYWLEWHEKFYPPPASVFYCASGLPVDKLLHMMRVSP